MEDAGRGGRRSRRNETSREINASTAGLTLGGILSFRNPTLLDLIRDDQAYGTESKKSWKMFRHKLRLKLIGSVCTTAVPVIASHVQINTDGNRMTTRNGTNRLNSPRMRNANIVTVTQTENVRNESQVETSTEDNRDAGVGGTTATVKVSLLSLLEVDGSAYFDDDEEQAEEVVVVVDEDGDGGGSGSGGGYRYNNCCVCMIRHKGAAFIPCGHTFCRVCSRELFVKRANCPLCNHFILEILDIF
ncbi:hypothetical protein R6Q59_036755 [Mikania micrantha]|uniref:RING-type domain-containing protein n=1 Tax=Mikania micrantha TaxID=192012 RepID=A0A5N6N9I3_9ASTR|nr:hypothetical protein E3N88_21956 [Mikania micrantha]KAD4584394.1 hypothetical protein E3N88_21995 [Mikania micrantha]